MRRGHGWAGVHAQGTWMSADNLFGVEGRGAQRRGAGGRSQYHGDLGGGVGLQDTKPLQHLDISLRGAAANQAARDFIGSARQKILRQRPRISPPLANISNRRTSNSKLIGDRIYRLATAPKSKYCNDIRGNGSASGLVLSSRGYRCQNRGFRHRRVRALIIHALSISVAGVRCKRCISTGLDRGRKERDTVRVDSMDGLTAWEGTWTPSTRKGNSTRPSPQAP